MRISTCGMRKGLVVLVMACLTMVLATAQEKARSNLRAVAAREGRAEINAHVAQWLKESDVPSVAVAYIENRKIA